jgi:hypothetical protein
VVVAAAVAIAITIAGSIIRRKRREEHPYCWAELSWVELLALTRNERKICKLRVMYPRSHFISSLCFFFSSPTLAFSRFHR